MPYSPSQHRLFCAVVRSRSLAKKQGISQEEARRMCHEGAKKAAKALVKRRGKSGAK